MFTRGNAFLYAILLGFLIYKTETCAPPNATDVISICNETDICRLTIANETILLYYNSSYAQDKLSSGSWVLNLDETYGSGIALKIVSMNFGKDSHLILSADENFNSASASVAYMYGAISDKLLVVAQHNKTYLRVNASSSDEYCFFLEITAYGTPPNLNTPTLPNPRPPETNSHIQIYLANITANYFQQELGKFKNLFWQLSSEFCSTHGIYFSNRSPEEVVFFDNIDTCPLTWPTKSECVSTRLALFVSDPKSTNYSLSSKELQEFWDYYKKNNSILNDMGAYPYELPDQLTPTLWTLLWVLIGTVIILAGGIFLCKCQQFRDKILELIEKEQERQRLKEQQEHEKSASKKQFTIDQEDVPSFMTSENSVPSSPPGTRKPLKSALKSSLSSPSFIKPPRFGAAAFLPAQWTLNDDEENAEAEEEELSTV